jgi:uncharacterized protein with HEPN domain
MSRRDDLVRLHHMRDHADEAIRMAEGRAYDGFLSDRMMQLALLHLVEIVGEAASRVAPDTVRSCSAIPWSQITGMRHRIVHGYDKIEFPLLWKTIQEDLPPLVTALDEAIARMEAERKR